MQQGIPCLQGVPCGMDFDPTSVTFHHWKVARPQAKHPPSPPQAEPPRPQAQNPLKHKRTRPEGQVLFLLEQVRGIEPPCSAWEADILPLNYTCVTQITWIV